MGTIRLTKTGKELPAYQTVYQALKADIQNQVYKPRELLPPEPELEELFGVSRTTIRRAISMLSADGLIRVKQGYGTEVLGDVKLQLERFHKFHNIKDVEEVYLGEYANPVVRGMHIDTTQAPSHVCEALELPEGSFVNRIQRINCIEGTPFSIVTTYINNEVVPDLTHFANDFINLYDFLYRKFGLEFEAGVEIISTCVADFYEAQILGVEVGSPLFFFKRTARTTQGLMEYTETKTDPARFELRVHMEGHPDYLSKP